MRFWYGVLMSRDSVASCAKTSCCCSYENVEPDLLLFHSYCCLYLVHWRPVLVFLAGVIWRSSQDLRAGILSGIHRPVHKYFEKYPSKRPQTVWGSGRIMQNNVEDDGCDGEGDDVDDNFAGGDDVDDVDDVDDDDDDDDD